MPARLLSVALDVLDPSVAAAFWGELLDRRMVPDPGGAAAGALLPGDDLQVGLHFVAADPEDRADAAPARLHLHLTSRSREDSRDTVHRALQLGGRHLDVGQLPGEDFVVLADPGGGAFCVIGPDNRFLADCGRLGEVTCEGTRRVGLFWGAALDWPLVWDQDGETAIQSPRGGTKISWGGPPVPPRQGRNHQRLELVAPDLDDEITRLVGLGATLLTRRGPGAELADPDGNELLLRPPPHSGP